MISPPILALVIAAAAVVAYPFAAWAVLGDKTPWSVKAAAVAIVVALCLWWAWWVIFSWPKTGIESLIGILPLAALPALAWDYARQKWPWLELVTEGEGEGEEE